MGEWDGSEINRKKGGRVRQGWSGGEVLTRYTYTTFCPPKICKSLPIQGESQWFGICLLAGAGTEAVRLPLVPAPGNIIDGKRLKSLTQSFLPAWFCHTQKIEQNNYFSLKKIVQKFVCFNFLAVGTALTPGWSEPEPLENLTCGNVLGCSWPKSAILGTCSIYNLHIPSI